MKRTVYVQIPVTVGASNEQMFRRAMKQVSKLVADEIHPVNLYQAKQTGGASSYVHANYKRAKVIKP